MKKCKHCGQIMEPEYRGWYDEQGVFHKTECFQSHDNPEICFECNFWLEHYENDKHPDDEFQIPFRCNHQHYIADINPKHKNDYFKGFGGAKTKITFNNGRVIECDNVWFQGDIPERFWEIMPDNATLEWLRE